MRGLIANLLDAESIEAGTLTIAPEPGVGRGSADAEGRNPTSLRRSGVGAGY